MIRSRTSWWWALALACGTAPEGDGPPADVRDSESHDVVDDSETPGVVDSEPVETDAPDTEPPPLPAPPADWGPGLVALPLPAGAPRALVVDPGSLVDATPPQTTVAFLADLDADGAVELFTATHRFGSRAERWAARVLRWTPGGLVDDDLLAAAVEDADPAGRISDAPLAALDLDGDGLVELIAGAPGRTIRWGRAPGAWDDWVALAPDGDVVDNALALADLDADGWLDLLLGGQGCDEAAWVALRTGPRRYDVRRDLLAGSASNARALLATVDPAGDPLVYVVDDTICAATDARPRFFRTTGRGVDGVPTLASFDATPVDAWWKLLPAFVGLPPDAVSPMGAGAEDLDGDGLVDLLITVGLPGQVVLRGRADGAFDDAGPAAYVRPSGPGGPEFPWAVGFPDLDLDGRPEVVWTIGDDASSFNVERGHPMRSSVSWNGGDLRLVEVGDAIGLDAEGSWQGLALGDPDEDGDADVVLAGQGRAPVAYRNDVDVAGRRGVTLRLVGTTSNALALGARVRAEVDGLPPRTATVGLLGNPQGIGEPLVFLGAGDAPAIDRLEITWPSGLVQELRDVPVGRLHTVVEPATVEILDPDRHAPGNATTRVAIRVTPRTPDGAPDPAATVTVDFEGAVPAVARPLAGSGGVWTMEVRSRGYGPSRVVVRIDGTPLRVRPKIWWDPPL